MTEVPSRPTHLMYRQFLITQNTDLVLTSLLLLIEVPFLQFTLVFKDLLKRVAKFALTLILVAQLG